MRTKSFTVEELRNAKGNPFGHPTEIRFQDVDGAAIVFFSRFFEYFHDAYAGFLGLHDISLAEAVRTGEWLAPLTHAEAEYISPLRFGDAAVVQVVAARIGRTSLRVGYRIVRKGTGDVCTVGQTVHVFVERNSFSPKPIPEHVRTAFASIA